MMHDQEGVEIMVTDMLKGAIAGFGFLLGIGLVVLMYCYGMMWIGQNVPGFWREGLLVVGSFAGIGAVIGALVAIID